MGSKEKVELIPVAIQQLMEEQSEKKLITSSDEIGGDDDHHPLLSKLLSQLETLTGDHKLQQLSDPKELPSHAVGEAKTDDTANNVESHGADEVGREEIIREIRKVRRQNFITHCLLSVMIVLTAAWQLSEVSLVLKVKNGLSNPLRSFGNLLTGMVKGHIEKAQNELKQSTSKQQQIEVSSIPPFQIPEMPHLELPLCLDHDEK